MYYEEFPNCCTATVLSDLQPSPTNGESIIGGESGVLITRADLERAVQDGLERGDALLVAITTNQQKKANRVLREFGFSETKYFEKETHPETKVKLWHYPLEKASEGE